jgi:hypothetical protein
MGKGTYMKLSRSQKRSSQINANCTCAFLRAKLLQLTNHFMDGMRYHTSKCLRFDAKRQTRDYLLMLQTAISAKCRFWVHHILRFRRISGSDPILETAGEVFGRQGHQVLFICRILSLDRRGCFSFDNNFFRELM